MARPIFLALLAAQVTACSPYGVRGGARPVAEGRTVVEPSYGGLALPGEGIPTVMLDIRRGIENGQELSLQILGITGLTATWSGRLVGNPDPEEPWLVGFVGPGVVQWGQRGLLHGGLVGSWMDAGSRLRFVGIQAMFVTPRLAQSQAPDPSGYSAGVFFGQRGGGRGKRIAWELGVQYEEQFFKGGTRGFVFAPSITVLDPRRSAAARN